MSLLQIPNIFLMPKWTYRAIVNSKVNIGNSLTYSVLKDILSTQDIADIFYLNEHFKLLDINMSSTYSYDVLLNLSSDEIVYVDNIIKPLADSNSTADVVTKRLYGETTYDDSMKPYKILISADTICVILDEGFLKYVEDERNIKTFLKSLLKEASKILSQDELSRLDVYKAYMELL